MVEDSTKRKSGSKGKIGRNEIKDSEGTSIKRICWAKVEKYLAIALVKERIACKSRIW